MGDMTHYAGDQCPGGHYEETIVPEPMTDDDLAAIERLLMYDVIGTDPADASGATTDDVAEVAGDLLAEVKRLQEERSAMLDVIEAADHMPHDVCWTPDEVNLNEWARCGRCVPCRLSQTLARVRDLFGGAV